MDRLLFASNAHLELGLDGPPVAAFWQAGKISLRCIVRPGGLWAHRFQGDAFSAMMSRIMIPASFNGSLLTSRNSIVTAVQ